MWWFTRAVALSIIVLPGYVFAATEQVYEVAQVLYSDSNDGLISNVTFMTWADVATDPLLLVRLTVAESRVSTPHGFQNRNVATAVRVSAASTTGSAVSSDTLSVVLDTRAFRPQGEDRDRLLGLVVQCMTRNAERDRSHPFRFLRIDVEGESPDEQIAGTYSLAKPHPSERGKVEAPAAEPAAPRSPGEGQVLPVTELIALPESYVGRTVTVEGPLQGAAQFRDNGATFELRAAHAMLECALAATADDRSRRLLVTKAGGDVIRVVGRLAKSPKTGGSRSWATGYTLFVTEVTD